MHGEVIATTQLTPQLVRVTLGGAGLDDFAPSPYADSYVNAFFIPRDAPYEVPFDEADVRKHAREFRPLPRRITVRSWDPERRELALDFAVHGDVGYAGSWAFNAKPGDRLQFRGPGGGYSPHSEADSYMFVGDESALPAIAVAAESVPEGRRVTIVAEVEDSAGEIELRSTGNLDIHWVHRAGRHDENLLAEAVHALPRTDGTVSAFVHGEAESIRAVRRVLLGENIVTPEYLSCSPYWRHGHTDEQWRSVKAAWVREVEAEPLGVSRL
ncbi:siderophore-interacting protein [Hoyosella rhizosphaerae]|uniref:Siderophore-interacting protein n=1 Tax=Hoyosella rhizosphaerae TaxID=1755582 RepID=A0A916U1S5_9ACTN|nr:siderophore-interacting protein [Hoyosella rhizosphaerae]MBN4927180.1 siderophore-interacting protein [Hoyosella rhizosphaerae]GGC53377.1 siderophore-interacting protein [Hoyosella rhizosphaerae]